VDENGEEKKKPVTYIPDEIKEDDLFEKPEIGTHFQKQDTFEVKVSPQSHFHGIYSIVSVFLTPRYCTQNSLFRNKTCHFRFVTKYS
jgi:hypothetical protein